MKIPILSISFSLLFLFGCVDIKIKSELPKKTYYDLDAKSLKSRHCKQSREIGLIGVNGLAFFDNKNIIQKDSDGKITILENVLWVDNPKEMLKNMILKNALNQCLEVDSAGMKKQDRLLGINLLFLGFYNNEALIEIAYKITDNRLKTQSMGIIKKQRLGTEIKNLQELVQEAVDEILLLDRKS